MNRSSYIANIGILILAAWLLTGCVELPTNRNSAPQVPLLTCPPGYYSSTLPCTLTVTGSDPDGDMIAYQFYIEYVSGWVGSETTEWSEYSPSGRPVKFLLFGDEVTYSVSARARDEMNESSGYSDGISVTFGIQPGDTLNLVGSCGISGGAGKIIADEYFAYLSTWGNGLVVVDFSVPNTPQMVAQSGNFSSACIGRNFQAVFLLSDDTFDETLYAYDVSKPDSPFVVHQAEIFDGAHLDVEGDYALVGTGWFEKTILIVDITDPGNFSIVSTLEIGETEDVVLRFPYAYVMLQGGTFDPSNFYIVDCSNLNAPYITGMLDLQSYGPICLASNNYLYAGTGDRMKVIDISQPNSPSIAQEMEVGATCYDLHSYGNYLAIAQGSEGLRLFDISIPDAPAIIGEYNTPGFCSGVFCGNNYLFAADGSGGFLIFEYPASKLTNAPAVLRIP